MPSLVRSSDTSAGVKNSPPDLPALDAYMKAKEELDNTFKTQNFVFDKILCISATVNGKSYYYINDKIKSPIASKSDVYVNPSDMVKIAEEQLGETFDAIQGFSI